MRWSPATRSVRSPTFTRGATDRPIHKARGLDGDARRRVRCFVLIDPCHLGAGRDRYLGWHKNEILYRDLNFICSWLIAVCIWLLSLFRHRRRVFFRILWCASHLARAACVGCYRSRTQHAHNEYFSFKLYSHNHPSDLFSNVLNAAAFV